LFFDSAYQHGANLHVRGMFLKWEKGVSY